MTRPAQKPPTTTTTTFAMAPAAAQQLLERVIYEAVIEAVDFDAIHRLETMLGVEISNFCDGDIMKAADVAREMIDRAWHEVLDDVRRYFDLGPDGDGLDCELCEQEAAAHAKQPRA